MMNRDSCTVCPVSNVFRGPLSDSPRQPTCMGVTWPRFDLYWLYAAQKWIEEHRARGIRIGDAAEEMPGYHVSVSMSCVCVFHDLWFRIPASPASP